MARNPVCRRDQCDAYDVVPNWISQIVGAGAAAGVFETFDSEDI